MARVIRHGDAGERRSHGALPVVLFFILALAVSMFAIGYIAWQAPHRVGEAFELRLPKAPGLPHTPPLPNPRPR